jgi:hypothetical protein
MVERGGVDEEVGSMSTTDDGAADGFEPEDWPAPDPRSLSPEAVHNDPDDVVAALADEPPLPLEATEADVLDQRTESGFDVEDDEAEDR